MLIVTTDGLPGFEIRRVLGPVFGVAVHSDQGGGAAPASNSGTFRVPAAEQPGQHPYSQAVPQPHPSRPPVVARNLTIGLHGDGTH